MALSTKMFENKSIRCLTSSGETWYCGKDICDILGYAERSHINAILRIDDANKHPYSFFVPQVVYNDGLVIYISKRGFELLVMKSRAVRPKSLTKKLIRAFDLDVRQVMETREQSCIGATVETFAHERYEKQFAIGSYHIDLYFTDRKLAIECDEFGHRDRNTTKEIARQMFIETQLGCNFIGSIQTSQTLAFTR
jgi:prophage antirepressor-like protein